MSSNFFDALRVHPEPYQYYDERMIHEALVAHPRDFLDYLDQALAGIAAGVISTELPPKLIFTDIDSGGDFRVMPCVVRRGNAVCKTVKIVGTNVVQKAVRDQVTVGKAFRLDEAENYVTHILEACLLSSARTGACAALALKQLSRCRSRIVVIGAGRVGRYAGFYAAALGGTDNITFIDDKPERAEAAARMAAAAFRSTVRFDWLDKGTRSDADAVILATTARTALLSPAETAAPLVVSAGADTEDQHELTADWASVADIYVDTTDGLRVGDLLAWSQAGLIQADDITDMLTLYRSGPRAGNRRRVFISTGTALFDNLSISYAIDRHARAN